MERCPYRVQQTGWALLSRIGSLAMLPFSVGGLFLALSMRHSHLDACTAYSRTSWKNGYSRMFISSIPHIPGLIGQDHPSRRPRGGPGELVTVSHVPVFLGLPALGRCASVEAMVHNEPMGKVIIAIVVIAVIAAVVWLVLSRRRGERPSTSLLLLAEF